MSKVLVDRVSPYTAGGRVAIDNGAMRGPFYDVTHPDFGAKNDGTAGQGAAMQAAFTAAAGKRLLIPDGVYDIGTTTLNVPGNTHVQFQSPNAIIKYSGTSDALKIAEVKNVSMKGYGTIDVSGGSGSCVGLHIAGLWFGDFDLCVKQGPASSGGILIETSNGGVVDFGAYIIRINGVCMGPDAGGPGLYGIKAIQHAGDAVSTTHLMITGGWIKNRNYGIYLDHVSSGWIQGTALEADLGLTVNDAIFFSNCSDLVIMPGEMTGFDGWGINPGAGNANCGIFMPGGFNSLGAGTINRATYSPPGLLPNEVRVFGSRTDQGYYAILESIFSAAHPFKLRVNGGVVERTLFDWSEGGGLVIQPGAADVTLDLSGGSKGIKAGSYYLAARGVSADRGDASVTLTATDSPTQRYATALTANRTVTLPAAGMNGRRFRVVRTGLGAFTLDVGGLKTIPSATAAYVDVEDDGSAYRLVGYGTL